MTKEHLTEGIAEGFANERLLVVPTHRAKEVAELPVLRDLRVTHLGQFADATNHLVVRKNGTEDYVLIYCLAGRGGGDIAGEAFTLEAEDYDEGGQGKSFYDSTKDNSGIKAFDFLNLSTKNGSSGLLISSDSKAFFIRLKTSK